MSTGGLLLMGFSPICWFMTFASLDYSLNSYYRLQNGLTILSLQFIPLFSSANSHIFDALACNNLLIYIYTSPSSVIPGSKWTNNILKWTCDSIRPGGKESTYSPRKVNFFLVLFLKICLAIHMKTDGDELVSVISWNRRKVFQRH